MKLASLSLALCLTAVTLTSAGAATYTFDYPGRINTVPGNIAGQDGWFVLPASGDSSDVVQSGAAFINTSNNTNVMANPISPGPTGVHRMGRTNDGNFSFGSLAGATGLTLAFDTQVYNNAFGDITNFINFALSDANDNGAISSPTLAFSQQGAGPAQVAYAGSGGGGGTFNLPGTPTGDWIQLSLNMNFLTPGTGGTITYRDLTAGGGIVTIASGLNIGNPAAFESLWTTMWSRSDNLGGGNSHVVIDNLTVTPSFAAVPEMNGAWIAGACAVLLAGHWLRRRKTTAAA